MHPRIEQLCLAELRGLLVSLKSLEARLVIAGEEMDEGTWRTVSDDISSALTKIKRADVIVCRLSQHVGA